MALLCRSSIFHSRMSQKKTVEIPQLDVVKKIVETPGILQWNMEQIVDTPVLPVVEELAEASKAFSQNRVQQSSMEQSIENPAISLAEKTVEMPVTRTQEKTQHVVNTHVQHVVNAVEAEMPKIIKETQKRKKPIINEKINQVTKHVEIPQLQIVEKITETSETQITQGTQTLRVWIMRLPRQVVEIEAYLPAESDSPMFVPKPVWESPVVEYMANAREVRASSAYRCSSGPSDHIDSGADSLPNYSANHHWDSVEDTPVAQQSLLPTAQTAQKIEEIPHVRHINKVVMCQLWINAKHRPPRTEDDGCSSDSVS